MGVNAVIHLPCNVRIKDVADVMGILAGQKIVEKETTFNSFSPPFKYFVVEGVRIESCDARGTGVMTDCANIFLENLTGAALAARSDAGENAYAMYNFEPSNPTPSAGRLLYPKSTAFWIAIGKGLVDFFGGDIDYSDCDSKEADFKRKAKSNSENCPENDPHYGKQRERMRSLKPLTKADYEACKKHAAY
jgi:hypothetical protein